MNNFVFGSADPLLYGATVPRNEYQSEPDIKRQLDAVMQQYQQLQQSKNLDKQPQKDWLGNFDDTLKQGWPFEKDGKEYFEYMIKNEIVFVAEVEEKVVGYLAGSICEQTA